MLLLDVGEDERRPPVGEAEAGRAVRPVIDESRWERAVRVVVVVQGQAELLEVVGAVHAAGGLADLLHRRQQQADQDGDDRDHHQQLDQREAAPPGGRYWNVRHRCMLSRRRRDSLHGSGSGLPASIRSQTFTVVSRLPEYKRLPSGLNARLLTRPVWPRKVRTTSPVRLSQIFTVLSSPPEAIHRPCRWG